MPKYTTYLSIFWFATVVSRFLDKPVIKKEWLSWFGVLNFNNFKFNSWISWFSSRKGCIDYHLARQLIDYKDKSCLEAIHTTHSLDLGLTASDIILDSEGLSIPISSQSSEMALLATWEELDSIVKKQGISPSVFINVTYACQLIVSSNKLSGCHVLYDDGSKPWHVNVLSPTTGIPASLCPPLTSSGNAVHDLLLPFRIFSFWREGDYVTT